LKDRAIRSGLTIAATPERVWAILTDFARYREWNPFIRAVEGTVEVGSRLRVTIQPPTFEERVHHPIVVAVVPSRELRWRRHSFVALLGYAEHEFRIEPAGQGCRFRQHELFSGLAMRFVGQEVWMALRSGFEEMNAALKQRAEG